MAQTNLRSEDIYRGGAGPERSAGQLVKEVSEDLSTLVRKEVELAKQEIGSAVTEKLKGVAVFAIVGVLGFFVLEFLLLALRDGFSELWAPWIADLATVAVILVVCGAAAAIAIKKLKTPISTDLTKQSVKEDVELVKSLGKR